MRLVNLVKSSKILLIVLALMLTILVLIFFFGQKTALLIKSRLSTSADTPVTETTWQEAPKTENLAKEPTKTEPEKTVEVTPDSKETGSAPAPQPEPKPEPQPEPEPVYKNGNIKIIGDESCRKRTDAALALLKSRAPDHYALAQEHICWMECGEVGGSINPAVACPGFKSGEETISAGTLWYAGIIAHEYCHIKLYRDGQTYNGRVGESRCVDVQYDALQKMGADQGVLDYVKTLIDTEWWTLPAEEKNW